MSGVNVTQETSAGTVEGFYDPKFRPVYEAFVENFEMRGEVGANVSLTLAIPKVPLNLALLKGCQIVGVFWGAFTGREPARHQENLNELMAWFKAGKLRPHVSRTYRFDEVVQALNDMAGRKVKGKIVLVPSRQG